MSVAPNSGLASNTPNNGVLDTLNQFTEALGSLGQNAANIYSSFLGARATRDLARSQRTQAAIVPTYSPANPIDALLQNKTLTFGAVAIVGLAGYLVYKAVK